MGRKGQVLNPFDTCGCPTPSKAKVRLLARGLVARTPPVRNSWLLGKIAYYQRYLDPQLKRKLGVKNICKFYPSCSEYSKASIRKYGPVSGAARTAWRLLRCTPLTSGGYDPV
ncbi:MAG: membrane protein insertion efficiency factor YidD [Candidatus Aenigmarchaeota archaeon]|nr:membrane protein insertion efficiency factor YidD [Candidatus Aenigmarchaeota archaeon]